MSPTSLPPLPTVADQVARLSELDLLPPTAPSWQDLPATPGALVALRHDAIPVVDLVSRLTHEGKPGFVVEDMTDVAEFVPTPETEIPPTALYVVTGLERGDEMRGWSPAEALPALGARDRSPLTVHEGLSWLLQQPEALEDNHCFMTIASRRPTARGYDARTPALWISRGTGRDGVARRHAPKLGWCWWNNRHTWLGFASCSRRLAAEV